MIKDINKEMDIKSDMDFDSDSRKEELKKYLKRLGNGENIEDVRSDFVKKFSSVNATEIMEAEQELLKEGMPLDEVKRLCDVHSALFHHGENNQNEEEKDYTDKNKKAERLKQIKGHPLYTFSKENLALKEIIKEYKNERDQKLFTKLREVSTHYAKKGDLLYPNLKVRYGISGPSDVMWTVDDEIRDEFSKLAKEEPGEEAWNKRFESNIARIEEMIYKEENILFPICAVNFSEDEWHSIYHDSKDYDICFGIENEIWQDAEQNKLEKNKPEKEEIKAGEVVLPGGHMSIPQLRALLNTIPLEITFIDDKNINRFFNEGPKGFKRPSMAIDRDVFSCHPPKIEPMVRKIIDDFRSGEKDTVEIWMEKAGRTVLVKYMAVRDFEDNYLGTMEIVQDMEFAKEHFN